MIQGIITSLLSLWVIWYLSKKYPVSLHQDYRHLDQKVLAKKYRILNFNYTLGFLLASFLGAIILESMVSLILQTDINTPTSIRFEIPISHWAFYAGGAALGLGFFSLYIFSILRRFLGENKCMEFITFLQRNQNMNVAKLNRHLGIGFILLGALITLFSANTYTIFSNKEIKFSTFWELNSHTYAYTDIDKIIYFESFRAPIGELKEKEHFVIRFIDGNSWNSRNLGFDDEDKDDELFNWLESINDTKIDYQEINED